jgi:hypothetical protein
VTPEEWQRSTDPAGRDAAVPSDLQKGDGFRREAAALREAGCHDEEILRHCSQAVHVRGCFLIDMLLGKE